MPKQDFVKMVVYFRCFYMHVVSDILEHSTHCRAFLRLLVIFCIFPQRVTSSQRNTHLPLPAHTMHIHTTHSPEHIQVSAI